MSVCYVISYVKLMIFGARSWL